MGGLMSGRYGGRPTVESTRTLDLYKLIRQGLLRPGHNLSRSIVWTRAGSDEPVGAIDYEAHMTGNKGHVRLRHTITDAGSAEAGPAQPRWSRPVNAGGTGHPSARSVEITQWSNEHEPNDRFQAHPR
jgi:hypothetical protein